jgi:hypothetical protein
MPRLRAGVIRYASAAREIGLALGLQEAPDCRIGQGRIRLIFRNVGATRWNENEKVDNALRIADVARLVLANDSRRVVRRRANRAIVVVYEDMMLLQGCEVIGKWECVVPARFA